MAVGAARPDEGRRAWLSELYLAHARAVNGYCRRFLRDPEDAADATHEVFLRALSSLQALPGSGQARRWLITVAQNYCLDLARRKRRMQVALTTLAADAEGERESQAEILNRQVLEAVLRQLGQRERLALWQSAVERRSLTEIAGRLGISYMAAAQLLHRARKHASSVAAKLAAILGLAGLKGIRRRAPALAFVPSLAAITVLPLVVAVATSSSTIHPAAPSAALHTAAVGGKAAAVSSAGNQSALSPDGYRVRAGARLRQALIKDVDGTLGTLVSTVEGPLQPLLSPLPTSLPTSLPTPHPRQLLPSPLPSSLPSPLPPPPLPKRSV